MLRIDLTPINTKTKENKKLNIRNFYSYIKAIKILRIDFTLITTKQ